MTISEVVALILVDFSKIDSLKKMAAGGHCEFRFFSFLLQKPRKNNYTDTHV